MVSMNNNNNNNSSSINIINSNVTISFTPDCGGLALNNSLSVCSIGAAAATKHTSNTHIFCWWIKSTPQRKRFFVLNG